MRSKKIWRSDEESIRYWANMIAKVRMGEQVRMLKVISTG